MNDKEKAKEAMLEEVGNFLEKAAHHKRTNKEFDPKDRPSPTDSRRMWRLTEGVIEEVVNKSSHSGSKSDKE